MTDEAIEAAAMALFDANVFGTRSPVAVRDRPTVHDVARIALAAAVPYIEAGLREQIAAEIEAAMDADLRDRRKHHDPEPCEDESWECHASGACSGFTDAARVARGTQEATK